MVTVQTAKAERGEIQQIIRAEAILFPRNQSAITPKVVGAGENLLCQSRQPRAQRTTSGGVGKPRPRGMRPSTTKAPIEQAQANYGIATSSALPEDWQKAEYDLKTSKEAYDAQQKVYDSRQVLYKEGAMPRKDLDAAAVALAQAKVAI